MSAPLSRLDAVWESFIAMARDHARKAVDAGFSTEAAEQMAVQLHSALVALWVTSGDESEGTLPPSGDPNTNTVV